MELWMALKPGLTARAFFPSAGGAVLGEYLTVKILGRPTAADSVIPVEILDAPSRASGLSQGQTVEITADRVEEIV